MFTTAAKAPGKAVLLAFVALCAADESAVDESAVDERLMGATVSASVSAQQPCGRPWVVGNADGNYVVPGAMGDVAYRVDGGQRLALDAYVPPGPGPHPAAVILHGGGWKRGSRVAHVTQLFEPLAKAGIAWFSLDYRVEPHNPMASQDDVAEALRFIRCHAPKLRVDAARLALIGEDSGVTMATLEAAENHGVYRGLVALGGDFPDRSPPTASLHLANLPPALVIHGAGDRDVPPATAMRFCDAIRVGGGTKANPKGACLYYVVEGAIHRFENWRPEQQHYKAELVPWLRARLGMPAAPPPNPELSFRVSPAAPPAAPHSGRLLKDIEYAPGLRLDAWIPPGSGPHPAVIIAHGGGWEAGDKVTYIAPLFEPLAKAGFAWFSIDYRLTPSVRHPEQLDDLRRAIRFVRHNAARFGVDPRRIAILGESASGQMVAQVASRPCEGNAAAPDVVDRTGCRPDAVVSFYGVYNLLPLAAEAGARPLLPRLFGPRPLDDAARELLREYSPLTHADRGLPPMLLIQGTDERLYAQAVEYARRLKDVGARHELYLVEGAPHGLENWEGRPEWQGYKRKLVEWLATALRR